jgi:hypothetical protein
MAARIRLFAEKRPLARRLLVGVAIIWNYRNKVIFGLPDPIAIAAPA